ncbi:MAG TPA: SDR family NAD(P)-dependent oxidoreductase [Bacteroidota bacterium]|nr:SDR family NAD(P)-dependent oxidoreductase [Bacteroidota bacterium]
MDGDLRGKSVIVTGASSGIGKCVALRFAQRGAKLTLVARHREGLDDVAKETHNSIADIAIEPVDVTDRAAVQRMVERAEKRWGGVDIVVAAAGQYVRVHGRKVTIGDVEKSMDVNFYGTVNVFLAVLPGMLQRASGRLIAISSVDGKKGLPFDAPYVAAKFAVTGFMDSMRQDLRGSGVALTTVLPGRVDTPMIGTLMVPWVSRKISPERVADVVERSLVSNKPEIIVPLLGPKLLLWAAALSSRFADGLIRLFRLEGTVTAQSHVSK